MEQSPLKEASIVEIILFGGFAGPAALALLAWRTGKLDGERSFGLAASTWVIWWSSYFLLNWASEWLRAGEPLVVTTALALLGGFVGLTGVLVNTPTWLHRLLYVMAGLLTFLLMHVSLLSAIHFFVTPIAVATFIALAVTTKGDKSPEQRFEHASYPAEG